MLDEKEGLEQEELDEVVEESNQDITEDNNQNDTQDELDFTEDDEGKDSLKKNVVSEKNPYAAQKRKEREEKEKRIREEIRQKAYVQGIVEATGGTNPYTGEEIKDKEDVEEYLAMRDLEKKGQDPIGDFHKRVKEQAKEQNKKAEEEQSRRAEIIAFAEKYPSVDLDQLFNNQKFVLFAGKRLGKETLLEVYQDYENFTKEYSAEAEQNAEKKVKEKVARAKSSPGSLTGSGGNLPKKSYADMSSQEFEKALKLAKSGALRKT